MSKRDRVIFRAAFTLLAIGIAVIAVFAVRPWGASARTVRQLPAAVCHFDGGGTLAAGDAARTSDGHVWECTEDGGLVELSAVVRHAAPSAHPSLPSWVHWAPASSKAAREVCGRGVQAIAVWGGSGDTSAVVCQDGKADVS